MIPFFIGLFLGANISLFLYACILVGKDADENIKTIDDEYKAELEDNII